MLRSRLLRLTISLFSLALLVGVLPNLRGGTVRAAPPAAEIPEIIIEAHD